MFLKTEIILFPLNSQNLVKSETMIKSLLKMHFWLKTTIKLVDKKLAVSKYKCIFSTKCDKN